MKSTQEVALLKDAVAPDDGMATLNTVPGRTPCGTVVVSGPLPVWTTSFWPRVTPAGQVTDYFMFPKLPRCEKSFCKSFIGC